MAKKKKKKKTKSKIHVTADFPLMIIVLGFVIFGVIMVFSASYYDALNEMNNPYYYLIRSSAWAAIGIVAMFLVSFIPYEVYYKLAPVVLAISLVLLILIFVPGIGETRNYATRWIEVGGITLMPGEVAKVAVIVFVAWYFARNKDLAQSFFKGVLPMFILAGVFFALIYMQPSLSTAIIVCGIIFGMLFVAGMKWIHLAMIGGVGVAGVIGLIFVGGGYGHHMKRITTFMDPFANAMGDGYQVIQSLLALGAGGVTGVGLGKSIQKALYLPEAQNDFIFAIIGEELGFIGCLFVLAAYVVLIWRCSIIALRAPDQFSMLVAAGVTIMIALQVIMNIAVVTSSMPATGVALPFISYGGNAMLTMMVSMGMLLNISRRTNLESAKAELEKSKE